MIKKTWRETGKITVLADFKACLPRTFVPQATVLWMDYTKIQKFKQNHGISDKNFAQQCCQLHKTRIRYVRLQNPLESAKCMVEIR